MVNPADSVSKTRMGFAFFSRFSSGDRFVGADKVNVEGSDFYAPKMHSKQVSTGNKSATLGKVSYLQEEGI